MVSWSNEPSPADAIHGVDSNSSRLLDRIRRLFGQDPRWDTLALKSLRSSLEQPAAETRKESLPHKPSEAELAKALADPDPNRRAEGLAAAGYNQIAAFPDKILEVALRGKGVEKKAAIYALGFYNEAVPEATLQQLLASEDVQIRFSTLELATRRQPARFARELMDILRLLVKQSRKASSSDYEKQTVAYLPRILCRLARGPLPEALLDGLKDPVPEVRCIVVIALQLAGNPEAAPYIEPLTHDADSSTREEARETLRLLGPSGSTPSSR
jgi:HEAT repeat protein